MNLVGEKLESIAIAERDLVAKDLFGRSAFNRYYYAAFLITREMLGEFKSAWKATPHKGIPELLNNSLKRQVSSNLKLATKKKLVTENEKNRILTKLQRATSELSNLLTEAYDVRVIADYEPEILLVDNGGKLILNTHKLTTARGWRDRASAHCKEIRSVWKDAGFV